MGKNAGMTMKFLPKEECAGVTTILVFCFLIDEVVIGRRLQIQVLETGMIPKQEATFLNLRSEFLKASWGWVMLSPHLAKLRLRGNADAGLGAKESPVVLPCVTLPSCRVN